MSPVTEFEKRTDVGATSVDSAAGPRLGASPPRGPIETFATRVYGPIQAWLPGVEELLRRELQSPIESLTPLLRQGGQLGGKRLRPALLLLSAEAIGEGKVRDEHLRLAVVLEMVHTATLIHDDVLDEAELRRRVPTIHAVWGPHAAILLGDYLFSQAYRLAATLPSTLACRWIGEAARRVCEGELRQVLARGSMDLDEATYLEMIRGKTAELCGAACRLGGRFAGGTKRQTRLLREFGDSLGIAFQIADDYLDLWGDDQQVGKTLGTDLKQGKWTLPVIRALQTAAPHERNKLMEALAGPPERRWADARVWLERSDAQEYTRSVANAYRDRALAAISDFSRSPATSALEVLAEFSVNRSF